MKLFPRWLSVLLVFLMVVFSKATPADDAARLFKENNWVEARTAFDALRDQEKDGHSEATREAVEGAVACSMRLQEWDDALARAEAFIGKTRDSYEEALGQRFLAGLYRAMPHQGIKQGGRFLRGESGQGVYVYSWKKDRRESVAHLERAREVLIALGEKAASNEEKKRLRTTQIGVNFDLASTLAEQSGYGQNWGWWWDGHLDEEEESEAVEEADYEEARGYRGWGGPNQERPTGIPRGADGQPHFVILPAAYSVSLGDGEKIRFLLAEISLLDDTEKKDDAARALFRRAMIARTLYGPETERTWRSFQMRQDRFGRALAPEKDDEAPTTKLWELADDQALTPVGGQLRVVDLPPEESPLALLRAVQTQYPASDQKAEAQYAIGLFYQTREQFPQAEAAYKKLAEDFPGSPRVGDAASQLERIRKPAVILDRSGIQIPGRPIDLAFTFRNARKIEFTALRFDLARCVEDRLDQSGNQYWNSEQYFSYELFQKDRWQKYTGEAVAHWSEDDARTGVDYRSCEAKTRAPFSESGAYLVEARVEGGEVARVLVMVTDIAIVQKKLSNRGLIYVCDAVTGLPLANEKVRIYEHWDVNDNGKSRYFVSSETKKTDVDGVIEYQRTHGSSRVDALVPGKNGRMAFSSFGEFANYNVAQPGENEDRFYVITDRPVYRPGALVKFSVWQRRREEGAYVQPRLGPVRIDIYDAKNVSVKTLSLTTDENGRADGEFALGTEPPLGIYRIDINGNRPNARTNAGGLFRVEEYKSQSSR